MGRDKTRVLLAGRPLAHWAAASLAAVASARVQVGGEPVPGLNWRVLPDLRSGIGPAAALETVLAACPGAAAVVCPADCPFVPPGLLREAAGRLRSGTPAAVVRHAGRWHPLIGAWSPASLPSLSEWIESGRRSLHRYLQQIAPAVIEGADLRRFGDPEYTLYNVNDPEQLALAERWLQQVEHL